MLCHVACGLGQRCPASAPRLLLVKGGIAINVPVGDAPGRLLVMTPKPYLQAEESIHLTDHTEQCSYSTVLSRPRGRPGMRRHVALRTATAAVRHLSTTNISRRACSEQRRVRETITLTRRGLIGPDAAHTAQDPQRPPRITPAGNQQQASSVQPARCQKTMHMR